MQMNRQSYLAVLNEGKAAFTSGDPSDACPYDRLGDAEQQFGYRYWNRGWAEARTIAEASEPEPATTTGQ
ncbi:hypothetical protein ACIP9H_33735 [Streptomyces sp. NPDC088732]|uniref:hypothetical protein n=1 Tax=Streptomyces sp. NPDC088732 TaxID=3365879 RepID=UPI0038041B42